ncbi:mitochondrial S-adenosylmethionine carrier protein isoform X1 [Ursus arctos]|uniref:mitochondrial S-adenosylmethionine carrier protein isoform X1 n=1 Tax=Ursus arctos TaxID=9644 RepID=UPI001CF89336|nr:mitochondrial S-adenosylmethionine carrier protein isoform X1 [Ursus arctos]
MDRPGFTASLVAGGVAGVAVDLILFPLDTIKTRLQSPQGFNKAGGFRGIYAGVPSAAIGSFPNAAAFFITYEYVKWFLHTDSSSYLMPVKHMLAASAGEVVACLIRVPSEVVKQRAQVSASSRTFQIFSNILYTEGIQGLYRGYKSTVLREIPFSLVQFPLWESLKEDLQRPSPRLWMWQKQESCWQRLVPAPLVGMCCLHCTGSGGHRGCLGEDHVLTPTWNMCSQADWFLQNKLPPAHSAQQPESRLFAGVFPRVAAISLGGFIFLGAYERARSLLLQLGRERPRVGDGAPGTALKTGGAVQAAARREQGS